MLLVISYQLHLQNTLLSSDFTLYYTLLKQISQTEDCVMPEIDPWDSSIQKYLSLANPLVCKQLQYELTYMQEGRIMFNSSEVTAAGYSDWRSISCHYRCFDKKEGNDITLVYGDWIELRNGSRPNCEFCEVKCKKSFPPISIYTNLHSQVIPLLASPLTHPKPPNVLLFVVDSVSNSNWQRNLPKTLKVLQQDYNSHVFKGFTKVGDNSFPNAIAFLTGKRVLSPGYQSELPDDMSKQFFDDWPVLWKDFKKQGYTTYYAEDYPQFNLFKYLSNGFSKKPTDHYFRPYWLQLYGSFLHRRSTHLCYGNRPCHRLQLEYLRDFIEKYRQDDEKASPTFALNWLTELGHDWLNQVQLGDDDLSEFFLSQKHNLKDSFVFVFSDHGHRFDPIRQSLIGRIEERMPFFSMHVPDWLTKKCSSLSNVLNHNSQKLTSFWDLYVTLRDVLDLQANNSWAQLCENSSNIGIPDAEKKSREYSPRGHSLLRPLPPVRTCDSAGIPEDFCICQREQIVNVTNPKVKSAASALIGHLNAMLADYSNECAKLQLKGIHNAQTFLPNLRMRSIGLDDSYEK
uniref:Sulfatase N-terminal domain-containing protein n=1 Tax=Ditylenchus dipsaci TaxID=166011 RepID=A0A915EIA8_9BILA